MDGPYKVLHDKSLLYFLVILFICLDWDSLYARLNSHYKAWNYKKKKHKKIKAYRKFL